MNIRIAGTVSESIVDGPGIRFAVFTQGCTHVCPGCQNPHTHDPNGGELVSLEHLKEQIASNPLLKGVTFSGGEPFEQPLPLIDLAKWCHERGLDVWSYTGFLYDDLADGTWGEEAQELLMLCDVLVDGPFVQDRKTLMLKWRGSDNQRVIDVPASLAAGFPVLLLS